MRTCGIQIDYTKMMAVCIGPEHGIRPAELCGIARRGRTAALSVAAAVRTGGLGFSKLPFAGAVADEVRRAAGLAAR